MIMKRVASNDKTTLLLNYAWQPVTCISARVAFLHMMKGKVCALDQSGNMYTSMKQWNDSSVSFPGDQPTLRSTQKDWPIPTVVVVTSKFYRQFKKKKLKLGEMAKIFNNQCQYCLERFPCSELTIDHIKPRSKGGSDEHENRTLACHKCNSKKSSKFPYFNVNNEKVAAPLIPDLMITTKTMRPEWGMFLPGYSHVMV